MPNNNNNTTPDEGVVANDAIVYGVLSDELLDKSITIARGRNREDRDFVNVTCTVEQFLDFVTRVETGPKDGTCILQGALVGKGGQRLAANMTKNHIIMFDVDNGYSYEHIKALIAQTGLFAVVWETSSHGATESEVLEKTLQAYLNKKRIPMAFDDEELAPQVREYLISEKSYVNEVFEGAVGFRRVHASGGVRYVVAHKPLPKHRILFVLDKPYSFSEGGTQQTRIAGWRDGYKTIATNLGLPIDVSGSDPSRLMYTPRHLSSKPKGAVSVFAGTCLDYNMYAQAQAQPFTHNPNLAQGTQGTGEARAYTCVTPGLMAFVKTAKDFDAVGLLQSLGEDRGPAAQGNGRCFACPNEEAHTHITNDDKAFFAVSGDGDGGSAWYMGCLHATCKTASGDDRLWYLDRVCVKHGLNVNSLQPYSNTVQNAQTEVMVEAVTWEMRERLANTPGAIDALINDTCTNNSMRNIEECVRHFIFVGVLQADAYIDELHKLHSTYIKKASLNTFLKQAQKEYKLFQKFNNAVNNNGPNGPNSASTFPDEPDDLTNVDEIWAHWSYETKITALCNRALVMNELAPKVFQDITGDRVVLQKGWDQYFKKKLTTAGMHPIVTGWAKYKIGNVTTGAVTSARMDGALVNDLTENQELAWPVLRRFIDVPIFGPDGTLRLTNGYDASTQCYIHLPPNITWLDVNSNPSAEEVETAKWWLFEALRDFPFTDVFDSADTAPIRDIDPSTGLANVDEDGFALPNMERGKASRTNAIAMILLPFMRHLIDGPCPIHHIDKASPGTGANYLVDVANIIVDGRVAEPTTMSGNEEEFRKNLVAQFLTQPSHLFIDNINKKVDSAHLASSIVSGVWKDRILGKSESVSVPVDSTVIMAGNNLEFSNEMMRRNCPIRLDAATPDPARDRKVGKDFKHDLQPWCMEFRKELVWACHTLIAAWVAQSCPRSNEYVLNSFAEWSKAFTGLFRVIGLVGADGERWFMANSDLYAKDRNEEQDTATGAMTLLFETFGLNEFMARDVMARCTNPFTQKLDDVFPVTSHYEEGMVVALGKWLGRQARTVVEIEGVKYSLSKRMVSGYQKYRFVNMMTQDHPSRAANTHPTNIINIDKGGGEGMFKVV